MRHPLFARLLARLEPHEERLGIAAHRRELVAGLEGRVVEIGAGAGALFRHYPPGVSEVVAVEPEPYLRRGAVRAAAAAPVPVRLVDAVAESLPLPDGGFDAAVASLVLCSVHDPARALAELHRVVRPDGVLRFYEHVRAPDARAARLQRAADLVWPLLAGGCHTARDTPATIEAAGFAIVRCRRFSFAPTPLAAPVAPHVLGEARRRRDGAQPGSA